MKIYRDEGQVMVPNPVPLGQDIDAVQIAHSLVFSQAANGPGADSPYKGFNAFILGRYSRIADDI